MLKRLLLELLATVLSTVVGIVLVFGEGASIVYNQTIGRKEEMQ
jgi:hypothetical protein